MTDKTTRSFAAHSKDARWVKEGLRPYFKTATWASKKPPKAEW